MKSMDPFAYETYSLSKSPEKVIKAEKIPTKASIFLLPSPAGIGVEPYPPDAIVPVGTRIVIRCCLSRRVNGLTLLPGKPLDVRHRLNTGSWELLKRVTSTSPMCVDVEYTIAKGGKHTFYIEFPGDDTYAGCSKAVKTFAR